MLLVLVSFSSAAHPHVKSWSWFPVFGQMRGKKQLYFVLQMFKSCYCVKNHLRLFWFSVASRWAAAAGDELQNPNYKKIAGKTGDLSTAERRRVAPHLEATRFRVIMEPGGPACKTAFTLMCSNHNPNLLECTLGIKIDWIKNIFTSRQWFSDLELRVTKTRAAGLRISGNLLLWKFPSWQEEKLNKQLQ